MIDEDTTLAELEKMLRERGVVWADAQAMPDWVFVTVRFEDRVVRQGGETLAQALRKALDPQSQESELATVVKTFVKQWLRRC